MYTAEMCNQQRGFTISSMQAFLSKHSIYNPVDTKLIVVLIGYIAAMLYSSFHHSFMDYFDVKMQSNKYVSWTSSTEA